MWLVAQFCLKKNNKCSFNIRLCGGMKLSQLSASSRSVFSNVSRQICSVLFCVNKITLMCYANCCAAPRIPFHSLQSLLPLLTNLTFRPFPIYGMHRETISFLLLMITAQSMGLNQVRSFSSDNQLFCLPSRIPFHFLITPPCLFPIFPSFILECTVNLFPFLVFTARRYGTIILPFSCGSESREITGKWERHTIPATIDCMSL